MKKDRVKGQAKYKIQDTGCLGVSASQREKNLGQGSWGKGPGTQDARYKIQAA